MGGMEGMVLNMLRAMGFDPEAIKTEITTRVADFEKNIATLNDHLAKIRDGLSEQTARLANIENHLGISKPPNGEAHGNGIRLIEGARSADGSGNAIPDNGEPPQ